MALSIGDSKVSKLYLGDTECKKAYLGDALVFGKEASSTLPDGYTQVEYIRFNGVKTSFALQENINCDTDKIVYKFYPENYGTLPTGRKYIFIASSLSSSNVLFIYFLSNNFNDIEYRVNANSRSPFQTLNLAHANKTLEFNMDFLNNTYAVNGINISGEKSANLIGKAQKFIGCSPSTSEVYSIDGKYYYFVHYRNEEVIHNYLPCVNSNGVPGIFDVNSQTFIQNTNQNATTITAGPAV